MGLLEFLALCRKKRVILFFQYQILMVGIFNKQYTINNDHVKKNRKMKEYVSK